MTPVDMAGMRWSILVPCLARRRFRMARATSTHVITMITASMATVTAATKSVEERPPPSSCSGYPMAGGGGVVGVSVVGPWSISSSLAIFHWRDCELFFFSPLLQYLMSSSKCIVFFECTMISHVSSDPSFSHTSPLDTELKKWAKYHLLTKN